jgi:hypothetical protein
VYLVEKGLCNMSKRDGQEKVGVSPEIQAAVRLNNAAISDTESSFFIACGLYRVARDVYRMDEGDIRGMRQMALDMTARMGELWAERIALFESLVDDDTME